MVYSFEEKLEFSKGVRQNTDLETIKQMIDGCMSVELAANEQQDKAGIDYIATLRGGAQIFIDAKTREEGCSRFWSNGPELALEIWSVMPDNGYRGKVGWTLDEAKKTDLVLYTWAPSDTTDCFLISFQLLRIAFRRNFKQWKRQYKYAPQENEGWWSSCMFVPVNVVFDAIQDVSKGQTP